MRNCLLIGDPHRFAETCEDFWIGVESLFIVWQVSFCPAPHLSISVHMNSEVAWISWTQVKLVYEIIATSSYRAQCRFYFNVELYLISWGFVYQANLLIVLNLYLKCLSGWSHLVSCFLTFSIKISPLQAFHATGPWCNRSLTTCVKVFSSKQMPLRPSAWFLYPVRGLGQSCADLTHIQHNYYYV